MFALNRLSDDAKICGRLTAANAQWNRAVTEDLGWPKKFAMSPEELAKYGYKDMHQFRNWRWFKGLGGGPLSDLGAHQIDIFNWWFGVRPRSVMASGGMDYYKNHEWYDNAMVIYEYPTARPAWRARFTRCRRRPAPAAVISKCSWATKARSRCPRIPASRSFTAKTARPPGTSGSNKNYLRARAPAKARGPVKPWEKPHASSPAPKRRRGCARNRRRCLQYEIPVTFNKKIHQPHLENFFNAIRGTAKLNCPADEAFASERHPQGERSHRRPQTMLRFAPEDFIA